MKTEKARLLEESYELSTSYDATNGYFRATGTESALASELFRNLYPATLSWKDLNVYGSNQVKGPNWSFRNKKIDSGQIHILKGVSGIVEPGELVALMGASGAGKTTLLNTLTGRNVNGLRVTGSVMCNGQEIGRQMTSLSAYVQQDDVFVGTLTVREHLIFHAMLRLPSTMSIREKKCRAEEVLFEVGLSACRNTRIGVAGVTKGISGGEAKRLAFASEILTNPSILFCDEPTTGLDAFMAENIVAVLQKLARKGKTILCTIHQPPSEIYLMFDKVHFLGEGRSAFFGTNSEAFTFFKNLGYPCPKEFNPPDHIVQTLAIVPGRETRSRQLVEKICDTFEQSDLFKAMYDGICDTKSVGQQDTNLGLVVSTQHSTRFKNSAALEFGALLWRGAIDNTRKINIAVARPVREIILGLLLGLVYSATKYDQQGITNYDGLLYFTVNECSNLPMWGIVLATPMDWPILQREQHNGIYRVGTYYASRLIAFAPFWIVNAIMYTTLVYFLAGLRPTAGAFVTFMFIGCVTTQVSAAMGLLISCLGSNLSVNFNIAWTLESFIYVMNDCTHALDAASCVSTGDEVLQSYGFSQDNFGFNIGMMVVLTLAYFLIGYLVLWFRLHISR